MGEGICGNYELTPRGWCYVDPKTGEYKPLGDRVMYDASVPPEEQDQHKAAWEESARRRGIRARTPGVTEASLTFGGVTRTFVRCEDDRFHETPVETPPVREVVAESPAIPVKQTGIRGVLALLGFGTNGLSRS
jgi:hypothetical protein